MVSPAAVVAATSSASNSNLRCGKEEWSAYSWRGSNDILRPILIFAAAKKNGPPAAGVAATTSAADTKFLCGNREWFRLQRLWRRRVPRPILIFAAAKENGFAYSGRSSNEVPRPILFFVDAKENGPPAAAVAATLFHGRL